MFVNNSSPAFVLSSIGIGMFRNIKIGVLLLITHILAAILIGIFWRFKYTILDKNGSKKTEETPEYKLSFDTVTKAITKTFYTMCMIFSFMIIFVLANNYLLKLFSYILGENKYITVFMLSIMELTSGLKEITALNLDLKTLIILISFLLGFSSLSINFQIYSCVYKNKFKLKNILKGKLLHGIFSALISYILMQIPIFYEYVNVSENVSYTMHNFNYINILNNHILISCVIFIIHICFFLIITKKKRHHIVSLKGG